MAVPNLFNFAGTVDGDQTILTGLAGRSWRVRQLNIQNREDITEAHILVKSNGSTIIGPIIIPPKQLLSLELASEEYQQMFILEPGNNLVINTDEAVNITVFGFAGLS